MQARAVVFDLDGTLVDTEPVGFRSWNLAAEQLGYTLPEGFAESIIGQNATLIRQRLRAVAPAGMDADAYFERARQVYHDLLHHEPVPLKASAREVLAWLAEQGVPIALCTSTNRYEAEHKLGSTGLRDYFTVMVCGDEVHQGKPHPEPYHKAAALLGVPTAACIALEDSPNGVRSAQAAGMRVILVPDMAAIPADVDALAWCRHAHLGDALACLQAAFVTHGTRELAMEGEQA